MGHVLQPDEGRQRLWVLGSLINARVTLADTGGLFELLEYTAPLGAGPPIHKHEKEIEAFYVIDGEVTMLVGEQQLQTTAGSLTFVPPGEAHTFRVDSDTAKFLQLMASGGLLPFFEEIGAPASSATLPPPSREPPDVEALIGAMARHGMQVLGPPLE